MRKHLHALAGVILAANISPALAQDQVVPGANITPVPAPSTATMTPVSPSGSNASAGPASAITPEELRATLRQRFPVGLMVPTPGDSGTTPPQFYYADNLVIDGVRLGQNGPVVRYSLEQLGGLVQTNISACNSAERWLRRIDELDQRRIQNAENSERRLRRGNAAGLAARLGGGAAQVGGAIAFTSGPAFPVVVGVGALVGLVDHFVNRADRRTFHENVTYIADVAGLDLEMRRGWIMDMAGNGIVQGGWCESFRNYELRYGNQSAARPPAPETADERRAREREERSERRRRR